MQNQAAPLALAFVRILREWLTPKQFAEMVELQRTKPQPGICYSHDYCDANMAMDAAFSAVFRRRIHMPGDVESGDCTQAEHDADFLAWDAAWSAALAAVFDPARIGVTRFVVDGGTPCTLAEFLAANADDAAVCEWACSAKPGDVFPSIAGCRAVGPADPLPMLSAAYAEWVRRQGLPLMSADELVHEAGITAAQRAWLLAFSTVWDGLAD